MWRFFYLFARFLLYYSSFLGDEGGNFSSAPRVEPCGLNGRLNVPQFKRQGHEDSAPLSVNTYLRT